MWQTVLTWEARLALGLGALGFVVALHLPARLWQSLTALFTLKFAQLTDQPTPFDNLTSPFLLFPLVSLTLWLQGALTLYWLNPNSTQVNTPGNSNRKSKIENRKFLTLPIIALTLALLLGGLTRAGQLLPQANGNLPASNYDEMVYFSGASLIAQGHLPYRDFFLAHPPGADLLYGVALRLSGHKTGGYEGFLAGRWLELLLGLLAGIMAAWVGGRIWARSGRGWAWAAGIAAGWLYLLDARAADIATLETPANFFGLAGLGCGLESERAGRRGQIWWGLASGTLLAVSVLCKLPGAALLLAWLVYLVLGRKWRLLLWVILGGLVASGLILGGLAVAGVKPGEMLRQMVVFQLLRPAEGRGKEQIGRLADDPDSVLTFMAAGLGLALLAAYAIVTRRIERRWLLPTLASLPLVAIFSLGKSFHPWYYVQWAGPLALAGAGLLAGELWQPLLQRWPRRQVWLKTGAILVALLVGGPLALSQWQISQQAALDQVYRLTATALANTNSAGLVFDPGYSFMAGLRPVQLPFNSKYLVDSAGYMVYLNLDMDRGGLLSLLTGKSSAGVEQGFQGERAQAIVAEGLAGAGWAVLDEKLARPQLTARTVEFIETAASQTARNGYADLYNVRQWPERRPHRFDNGLLMTTFGLSISKGGQANALPVSPGEIINLKSGAITGLSLDLRLVWRVAQSSSQPAKVFIHLIDEKGATVAQRDIRPQDGQADTSRWRPGDAYEDVHSLPLPANLPPGRYRVEMGLYQAESGPGISVEGQPALTLGYLEVS